MSEEGYAQFVVFIGSFGADKSGNGRRLGG